MAASRSPASIAAEYQTFARPVSSISSKCRPRLKAAAELPPLAASIHDSSTAADT